MPRITKAQILHEKKLKEIEDELIKKGINNLIIGGRTDAKKETILTDMITSILFSNMLNEWKRGEKDELKLEVINKLIFKIKHHGAY